MTGAVVPFRRASGSDDLTQFIVQNFDAGGGMESLREALSTRFAHLTFGQARKAMDRAFKLIEARVAAQRAEAELLSGIAAALDALGGEDGQ